MRAVFISDLHTDTSDYNIAIVDSIVEKFENEPVDVLCLLGDIVSFEETGFEIVLEKLGKIRGIKLFVPGNHEAWLTPHAIRSCSEGSANDSLFRLNKLSDICKRLDWHPLMTGPKVVDDIGFVGTIGWYDYSFRDTELLISDDCYESKQTLTEQWMDGVYTHFNHGGRKATDREVTEVFNEDIDSHLARVEGCKKRIACTHFVPFKVLQGGMHDRASFFNAFGGNADLGKVLANRFVDVSVSGHLHRNFHKKVSNIDCYQTAIGYLASDNLFSSTGKMMYDDILKERVLVLDI
jgi:3',5'-cyclic AMP phosphodiesterase CpdA